MPGRLSNNSSPLKMDRVAERFFCSGFSAGFPGRLKFIPQSYNHLLKPRTARNQTPVGQVAQSAAGTRLVQAARLLLTIWIWLLGFWIRYFPVAPGDDSSTYAMNYAHAKGMVFGRDVAFTYGPLAYLI